MKTTITRGYVTVSVPEVDCEGTQRSIDFPYVGKVLYGRPLYHRSCERYVNEAQRIAQAALTAARLEAEYDRLAMS